MKVNIFVLVFAVWFSSFFNQPSDCREMYELLESLLECTEFVSRSVTPTLAELTETWNRNSQVYLGAVEKINVAWRVPLDTDLLEEFPDIKAKVAKKLEWLGNEQLSILNVLIKRMFHTSECLKIKLDRINDKLEQISFEEHKELKHIIREHVMWIENCWTCLHCLFMQIEFAMISLEVLDEESAANLVNAINQDEKDKLILGKSLTYMQSCLNLLKFIENKSKIKITQ